MTASHASLEPAKLDDDPLARPEEHETVPVHVRLLDVQLLKRGELIGLASAEIAIAGIVLTVSGMQVFALDGFGKYLLKVPHHRGADGASKPSLTLPIVVLRELTEQLKERQSGEPPFPRPP